MRLWLFPIEPLEERYSADWARWWPEDLAQIRDLTFSAVLGDRITSVIETGQFLDAFDTNAWKATQLAYFAGHLRAGDVKSGDWVLLHDGWNPCLEQLAYMRQLSGAKFRIAALLHAGTWDPHDHVARMGLRPWARFAERAWAEVCDRLYFATEFHRGMYLDALEGGVGALGHMRARCRVTGFPLRADELRGGAHFRRWGTRGKLVVFPHRLAPEKDPEAFDLLKHYYRATFGEDGTEWVRSKDVCRTKYEYFELLGRARCAVSTAHQETWGIAMMEAAALGAWPVAPDRLAYPETLAGFRRYATTGEAVHMVRTAVFEKSGPADLNTAHRWSGAVRAIVEDMRDGT